MFRTASFDDRLMNPPSEEGFDFYHIETGQGYYIKFTPPSDTKFCPRANFPSRLLSRSVPRRNRSLVNFKINRSLQFDSNINPQEQRRRSDSFLSPKSVGHSPINKNLPLSRSAKILKALNIEYSPVMNNDYKKINKTLTFDLTPNSSRFKSPTSTATNSQTRRCKLSDLSLQSNGINKSLNFDSCDDSPVASAHDTSIESIDENQNQTPSSQRSRKIKKTLSYLSLSSGGSGTSSSFEFHLLSSPGLRTELREKIDDIVVTSMVTTPQPKLMSSGHKQLVNDDEITVSTPRNLYKDFTDDDNDDERPETPVNVIRLIPESMSAIKKSHRKERFTGRFMNRINQNSTEEPLETDFDSEERPTTPLTSDVHQSPNFSIHSIKKSHKKDKSKKKLCVNHSEDELSDIGSLFEYSNIEEEKEKEEEEEAKLKLNSSENSSPVQVNEEMEFQTPPKTGQCHEPKTPGPATPRASTSGRITPENRVDYLKRIMTDSIKKSHKKLKDSNKKKLFKSRLIERQQDNVSMLKNELNLNESTEQEILPSKSSDTNTGDRAGTPENMNSSRLLLSKFSSVKKSHRKDKHRKIGFAQRHIMMNDSNESSSPEAEYNKSPSKRLLNIPQINITEASTSKSSNDSSTSLHHDNNRYQSLHQSVLDSEDGDFKLISSPNKRKSPNVSSCSSTEADTSSSDLKLVDCQSPEEEFKIFTPIKKRKSIVKLNKSNLNECVFSTPKKPVVEICSDRCETPRLGMSILIPAYDNDVVKHKYSSKNKNNDDNNIKKVDDANVERTQSDDDTNGRQTPDNLNHIKMISSLSSIKKSHRKDKWAKVRTRESSRLLLKKNKNSSYGKNDLKDLSTVDNTNWRSNNLTYESSPESMEKPESSEELSPRPSTSSANNSSPLDNNKSDSNTETINTPPNCLKVKTYLRLIQNTSIKRSHKKMREKKKQDSIICDNDDNLSDDGSIFDEKEKIIDYENSGLMEDDDIKPLDGDNDDHYDKVFPKGTYSKSFNSNRSNDGSIFGSDDEMNSPSK